MLPALLAAHMLPQVVASEGEAKDTKLAARKGTFDYIQHQVDLLGQQHQL